ncbi:D-alanyl-D-alanine carboxypeptidase [invertebrate metagenome]|uniref:serine-type D-Ala-D-Ala carboxypeptidase n=1 Tax=invertebrate metagenome TaxID=1711999 RepID=A0A484H566_9ZZZZ
MAYVAARLEILLRPANSSRSWLAVFLVLCILLEIIAFPATVIGTPVKHSLVVDYNTKAILLEKNAGVLMHPSSMSKLMTLYMVFERLHEGDLSLDDTFVVNERAWRMGGSKMFVALKSSIAIADLLRGIIVQSANDACIVIAENLAGSEKSFAEAMTAKARRIGLTHSTFRNASGWPVPDHLMTARDLATLARRLIIDFPEYYPLFREMYFTYNGIRQGNRNPLLYKQTLGADGLKTGHTEAGGYGLIASAIRDGRRVIMVLNGLASIKQREQESERLVEWSFRAFMNRNLFKANTEITTADVWLGTQATVPLVTNREIIVTLPRAINKNVRATVVFDSPIPAPILRGERLATLVLTIPGIATPEIPLVAGVDIKRLSFSGRLLAAARHVLR